MIVSNLGTAIETAIAQDKMSTPGEPGLSILYTAPVRTVELKLHKLNGMQHTRDIVTYSICLPADEQTWRWAQTAALQAVLTDAGSYSRTVCKATSKQVFIRMDDPCPQHHTAIRQAL